MILTLITFIIGVVTTIMSFFGTLMITNDVSLLTILIVWQLFMIVMWLLNRLAHGSGSRGARSAPSTRGVDEK